MVTYGEQDLGIGFSGRGFRPEGRCLRVEENRRVP
jgi:hypothetical protein